MTLAGDLFLEPIHERQLIHSQVTRISRSFSEPQCFEIKVRAKINIALILCLTLDCIFLEKRCQSCRYTHIHFAYSVTLTI